MTRAEQEREARFALEMQFGNIDRPAENKQTQQKVTRMSHGFKSGNQLVPPPGYHIDGQGLLQPNQPLRLKPEPKYTTVYNNPFLAQQYRDLGYLVNHIVPKEDEFL